MSEKQDAPMGWMVTVCDACLTAICWHGETMCDRGRAAGTMEMHSCDLDDLKREHPNNYSREKLERINGALPPLVEYFGDY